MFGGRYHMWPEVKIVPPGCPALPANGRARMPSNADCPRPSPPSRVVDFRGVRAWPHGRSISDCGPTAVLAAVVVLRRGPTANVLGRQSKIVFFGPTRQGGFSRIAKEGPPNAALSRPSSLIVRGELDGHPFNFFPVQYAVYDAPFATRIATTGVAAAFPRGPWIAAAKNRCPFSWMPFLGTPRVCGPFVKALAAADPAALPKKVCRLHQLPPQRINDCEKKKKKKKNGVALGLPPGHDLRPFRQPSVLERWARQPTRSHRRKGGGGVPTNSPSARAIPRAGLVGKPRMRLPPVDGASIPESVCCSLAEEARCADALAPSFLCLRAPRLAPGGALRRFGRCIYGFFQPPHHAAFDPEPAPMTQSHCHPLP